MKREKVKVLLLSVFFLLLFLPFEGFSQESTSVIVKRGEVVIFYSSPQLGWGNGKGDFFISLIQAADEAGRKWKQEYKHIFNDDEFSEFVLGDTTSNSKKWVAHHIQLYQNETTVTYGETTRIEIFSPPSDIDIDTVIENYEKIAPPRDETVWSYHPMWHLLWWYLYIPWNPDREQVQKHFQKLEEHWKETGLDWNGVLKFFIETPNWSKANEATDLLDPGFLKRDSGCSSSLFWAIAVTMAQENPGVRDFFYHHPERIVLGDMVTPGQMGAILLLTGWKRVYSDIRATLP